MKTTHRILYKDARLKTTLRDASIDLIVTSPPYPMIAMWDGFVSNLRTYSVSEITDLVGQLGHQEYEWKIGRAPSIGMSRVTYAIGSPQTE